MLYTSHSRVNHFESKFSVTITKVMLRSVVIAISKGQFGWRTHQGMSTRAYSRPVQGYKEAETLTRVELREERGIIKAGK